GRLCCVKWDRDSCFLGRLRQRLEAIQRGRTARQLVVDQKAQKQELRPIDFPLTGLPPRDGLRGHVEGCCDLGRLHSQGLPHELEGLAAPEPTLHEFRRHEELEPDGGRTVHRRVAAYRASPARQLSSKLDTGNRDGVRNRAWDKIRLATMDAFHESPPWRHSEQRDDEHLVIDDRDERQIVAIEIAADELPATVILHPTLRRVQERMLDVRKGNATLLHSGLPVILIYLPSVRSREGANQLKHLSLGHVHLGSDLTKRQAALDDPSYTC
ncbi:MAG TPA: hypothetical protein VF516_44515, partial [Kofleriaceae bacterium]